MFNSAETGYEKPHPRAFQLVLEAFPDTEAVVGGEVETREGGLTRT
ncbi:MAG: hypothetical protein R6X31_11480 [Anaerolineae bacterium]